jgi:hypothetical protein
VFIITLFALIAICCSYLVGIKPTQLQKLAVTETSDDLLILLEKVPGHSNQIEELFLSSRKFTITIANYIVLKALFGACLLKQIASVISQININEKSSSLVAIISRIQMVESFLKGQFNSIRMPQCCQESISHLLRSDFWVKPIPHVIKKKKHVAQKVRKLCVLFSFSFHLHSTLCCL